MVTVANTGEIPDRYKSIAAPAEGLFKDNGSRFISLAYPVETEEEVKSLLSKTGKEYYDARHRCYAYRLGHDGRRFRANDDGEPSSSAGRPILNTILSYGLSDILVVVVRYFGGIKLGIPGLIRAYRTSAADALDNAAIIEKTAVRTYDLDFGYMQINPVMRTVKDMGLVPLNQSFDMTCRLSVAVRLGLCRQFEKAISEIGGCSFLICGQEGPDNKLQ